MNLFNLISGNIAESISWTIIHSLWQGLLIAVIYLFVKSFLKNASANLKYILGLGSMMAFVIVVAVTFSLYFQPAEQQAFVAGNEIYAMANMQEIAAVNGSYPKSLAAKVADFTSRYSSLIVYLYLIGLIFFGIRLIGGLVYIDRLKKRNIYHASARWYALVNDLAEKLNIKKGIMLAESSAISAPVLIGYFKPIVLLPLGALTGLSAAQVEAILAHELAHLKRNDYLINMMQSVVEAIFFYHPAIWWLSSEVRNERENCCDDMVLLVTNDSISYAKALAGLKMSGFSKVPFALAAVGTKKQLLLRINRILSQPKNGTSMKEKIITITGLLIFIFFIGVSANANLNNQSNKNENAALMANSGFSYAFNLENLIWNKISEVISPEKKKPAEAEVVLAQNGNGDGKTIKIEEKIDGKKHKIKLKLDDDGEIEQLKVNGKKIPEEKYGEYRSVIRDALGTAYTPSNARGKGYIYSTPAPPSPHGRGGHYYRIAPPSPPAPPVPGRGFIVPPVPPLPPMEFDPNDEESIKRFEKQMEKYEKQLEKFEKEFEFNFEIYEKDMDKWSKEFEKQFEKEFKIYADTIEWNGFNWKFQMDSLKKGGYKFYFNDSTKGSHIFLLPDMADQLREQILSEIDVEKIRKEAKKAESAALSARKEAEIFKRIEDELVLDNLISDRKNYSIEMDGKGLTVNGKKQNDTIYKKYKKMYESATGKELKGDKGFNISISNK